MLIHTYTYNAYTCILQIRNKQIHTYIYIYILIIQYIHIHTIHSHTNIYIHINTIHTHEYNTYIYIHIHTHKYNTYCNIHIHTIHSRRSAGAEEICEVLAVCKAGPSRVGAAGLSRARAEPGPGLISP